MNKQIKLLAAALVLVLAGGGCDYNDKYFDGLDDADKKTDVKKLEITLAEADYTALAGLSANKTLAGTEHKQALEAVGKKFYFNSEIPAKDYIPAFLASTYPTADNGSTVKVTYSNDLGAPEELANIEAADTYTVSSDDYAKIWGQVPANYFTPEKPLASSANKILQAAYPDAETGEIKVVAYNYSATEPNTGGAQTATSIDETFDGGLNAWQIVKGSSSTTWTLDDYKGAKSAKCSAFKAEGPQDLWLISEKVDLSTATAPQLGFDVKISYWNHDGLSVLVSTDYNGTTPEDATWTDITHNFAFEPKSSGKWYIAGVYDMSAFKTESVYVAFHYVGDAAEDKTTTYYIDNIQLGDDVVNIAETPLFEDAVDNFDKWTLVKVAGEDANQWVIKSFSGNNYAQASANKAAGAVESWLVTKQPIAVPALTSGVSALGFDLKIGFWNANCFSVLISEDYTGDVATATWSNLSSHLLIPEIPTGGYASDFSAAGVAPLYQYAGKSVYVAFKYVGNGANKKSTTYQIDNIKVASLARTVSPNAVTRFAITRAISQEQFAIYSYNGSAWQPMSHTTIVNPEDYTEMGASNPNFSSSFSADKYLPLFLNYKFPYAVEEDYMDVAYHFYDGTTTGLRADRYNFGSSAWAKDSFLETVTDQFARVNGKWLWSPSVVIIINPGKGQELATLYYQACVDWVKENIDDKAPEGSKKFVTSYGNNDYYSGASAFQGNLDWRVAKAREQNSDAYPASMSDEEVLALLKEHTIEVMRYALEKIHADAKAIPGVDILYTLQVAVYTGTNVTAPNYKFSYKVVSDGKFEYVADSFVEL